MTPTSPVQPVVRTLSQEQLQAYADAPHDHNPIHVDPEFARSTPFGGTIAHGMLVLALIGEMMQASFGARWTSSGRLKVRFKAPARPGDTDHRVSRPATGENAYAVHVRESARRGADRRTRVDRCSRMSEDRERRGRMCFACGDKNERGLHMEFRREGERTVCDYTPCGYQQGYPGRMHGGVVATLDRRSDGLGGVPGVGVGGDRAPQRPLPAAGAARRPAAHRSVGDARPQPPDRTARRSARRRRARCWRRATERS